MTTETSILTEEALLNAPEDDYMNDQQLEFFRQRLIAMKDELLEKADETTKHLQENEFLPDEFDRATVEEEYALELRIRDRERKLLQKIEVALKRIENKSYGFCIDTDEPIGIGRLLARPTAQLTIEAQERRDRVRKQYAG